MFAKHGRTCDDNHAHVTCEGFDTEVSGYFPSDLASDLHECFASVVGTSMKMTPSKPYALAAHLVQEGTVSAAIAQALSCTPPLQSQRSLVSGMASASEAHAFPPAAPVQATVPEGEVSGVTPALGMDAAGSSMVERSPSSAASGTGSAH